MKKFLSFIHWRHLKHLYHLSERYIPHYRHVLKHFLHTKNGKLVVIFIIAAAIPLTVIAGQQIQNLQQQAKETNQCTESSYPLQVFPNPAEDGKDITFRLAEGTIDEAAFQNDHFTGNGAVGCELSGGVIKCKARFNSKTKTKPQSDHTYEVHGNKCNYSVKNPDANKPTKPPKTVTNTPKPTRDPAQKTPTASKCEVNLSDYDCTADKKPRLRASWDMEGGSTGCKVTINGKDLSTECQNSSENIIKVDGKDLVNGDTYKLAIVGNSCNKEVSEKAPNCTGGNTPKPGEGKNLAIEDFICNLKNGSTDEFILYGEWSDVGVVTEGTSKYTVRIYEGKTTSGTPKKTEGKSGNTITMNEAALDKTYTLQIIAKMGKDASGKTITAEAKKETTCKKTGSAATGKLGKPDNPSASYKNDSQIVVKWGTRNTNATSYKVTLVSVTNEKDKIVVDNISKDKSEVTVDLKGDQKNKKYYVVVTAVGPDGEKSSRQDKNRVADPSRLSSSPTNKRSDTPSAFELLFDQLM